MSEKPGPQLVAQRLNECIALTNLKDQAPVHFEFHMELNPAQREVFNMIIFYTKNNGPLRTQLIGYFMAYGASTALNELRKVYPYSRIEISAINMGMFGRQL
jgi:hypothetical protein